MKKLVSSVLLCLLCLSAMQAKDLTDIKVYINPGHGGWNGVNDRHIATIPFPERNKSGQIDTLGFWESSSNLKVALDLDTLLRAANATTMLSRKTNQSGTRDEGTLDWDGLYINKSSSGGQVKHVDLNPYEGDRSFQMMREECNAFNADLLLSIHSNAANSVGQAANYVACFLPGNVANWTYKSGCINQTTVNMAEKVYYYMYDNPLDCIHEGTQTDSRWWTFVDEYSLLNSNNGYCASPVVLCEASFHSYLPNTHRYLNRDYQRLEAYRFYRALCDIWKADFPSTAIIAGDVRSANIKEKRAEMGSIINNPKNIAVAKDKLQAMNNSLVELLKDGQVIQTYQTDDYCNGIYSFYNVEPGNYQVRVSAPHAVPQTIDVIAKAGFTTTDNIFVTDSNYTRPIAPDYPNQAEDAVIPEKFAMNEYPLHRTPFLDGLNIRRMVTRGEKTYVLDNQSHIYVVNTYTGEQVTTLSTRGVEGGILALSDIALTSDTVLIACNKVNMKDADTESVWTVYQWANDDADPSVLYAAHFATGYQEAEVGETMAVKGTVWWHRLYVAATNVTDRMIAVLGLEYMDKEADFINTKYMQNPKVYREDKWGTDYRFMICPAEDLESYLLIDSKVYAATQFKYDWTQTAMTNKASLASKELPVNSYGISFLQYAGTHMMVVPVCKANGASFGLRLYRMKQNTDWAQIQLTEPLTDLLPSTGLNTEMPGYVHSASVVEGNDLNLVLYLQGIGIARYSTAVYTGWEHIYSYPAAVSDQSYDLLGRPVDASFHGVVIRNGRKTLQ